MTRDIQQDISEILISPAELSATVQRLGQQISEAYAGTDLILLSVLKGAIVFLADLMRAITIPMTIELIAISSYGGQNPSGAVRLIKDLDQDIMGRHVLVVEDIVDTGLTLSYLLQTLRARQPASLQVCTLLDRAVRRIVNLPVAFRGFEIPDRFVVGYGLDYRQYYRNLPFIGILKPEALA